MGCRKTKYGQHFQLWVVRRNPLYLAQKIFLYKDERKIAFVLRRHGALIKCVLGGARTPGAVAEGGSAHELIPCAPFIM